MAVKLPLLASVPHGGVRVPPEAAPYCRLTEDDVRRDGDECASEIYAISTEVEAFVSTEIARAIVDLNRAVDDRRPDGVVKTHTCLDVPVYEPFPPDHVIDGLLESYYHPYHRRLTELAGSGVRLGVDCHTMLAVGPPMGPMAGEERPRICLGDVDGSSCPPEISDALAGALAGAFGVEVIRNAPFKGGYITRTHSAELPWIQIELSRAPFMTSGEKRERLLQALEDLCRRMGWLSPSS